MPFFTNLPFLSPFRRVLEPALPCAHRCACGEAMVDEVTHNLLIGIFPLILTVLNEDENCGCYDLH